MSSDIKSLQRALEILEYIANYQGAGVSQISRELSLNKSTVFSILKTFVNLGYLYKNEINGNYQLTYRIQSLALKSEKADSFISFANPILRQLQKKYKETIHFVSSSRVSVIYIGKFESTKAIRIHTDIGVEMPLHCTAVGKTILAWRSKESINDYAEMTGLPMLTSNTITELAPLQEELREVREKGYAIDDEENQDDLYCIGVPVFNQDGKVKYAISLSMPKYRKEDLDFSELIVDLKQAATELEKFF